MLKELRKYAFDLLEEIRQHNELLGAKNRNDRELLAWYQAETDLRGLEVRDIWAIITEQGSRFDELESDLAAHCALKRHSRTKEVAPESPIADEAPTQDSLRIYEMEAK